MRLAFITLCLLVSGILFSSLMPTPTHSSSLSPAVQKAVDYFRTGSQDFSASCNLLSKTIKALSPKDKGSILAARQALTACRNDYKKIESFMEYFFLTSARIYNSPPKFEGEEPAMEYQPPMGLQVIEDGLYQKEKDMTAMLNDLRQQASAIAGSAADISAMLYDFQATDAQLLESLRLELIRIMTLGITGYDAPLIKTGITESYAALASIRKQLTPYLPDRHVGASSIPKAGGIIDVRGNASDLTIQDSIGNSLDSGLSYLRQHPGFDEFDRLEWLTKYAIPLQRRLGAFIRRQGLTLNTVSALNYDADHLFSRNAFDAAQFPDGSRRIDTPLVTLGRMLFFDKTLSGNGRRSCATCHIPEKMFTDGLIRGLAIDEHSPLPRNTPTLLYSSLQYAQFWDGRATSLRRQIGMVLANPAEMNADTAHMDLARIGAALAAYLHTLTPLGSPFDRYMNGDPQALDERTRHGANLFMGRAQCATCHFAPLFNGLIPPYYKVTEFEILGTTASDKLSRPRLSPDSGRYSIYPLEFYLSAFKTPTVRNAALTAPYMHNGAFHDLETLMDFYNRGGGAGLGLRIPTQTLPARPLNLSKKDMADIILFIQSLSDPTGSAKK